MLTVCDGQLQVETSCCVLPLLSGVDGAGTDLSGRHALHGLVVGVEVRIVEHLERCGFERFVDLQWESKLLAGLQLGWRV